MQGSKDLLMDSSVNFPCSCSNRVIYELGDKMVDLDAVCIVKHKLYIYRKLIEWHIPRPVRRYLVGKKGICILMKIIPYKDRVSAFSGDYLDK